jgi:diguanylate cyclase (GGDEF)-like protein/PAS domain S-box-containing protein
MNSKPPKVALTGKSITGLSLFQKLCAIIFIMICVVMLGRGALTYNYTLSKYEKNVQLRLKHLEQTFKTLADRTSGELFRNADRYPLPSTSNIKSNNIPAPSLMSGIDSIVFISTEGKVLATSEIDEQNYLPKGADIQSAVRKIAHNQRPVTSINCNPQCTQSVFIPVINNDGDELIVNINRSASLIAEDFYDLTGAELVLFSLPSNSVSPQVHLSTHGHKTAEMFAALYTDQVVKNSNLMTFFGKVNEHYLGAHSFNITSEGLKAAIITDESGIASLANETLREVLIAALLTSIIVILIVYVTLRPPLQKLNTITRALPLLSSARFDEVRDALSTLKRKRKYADEIDLLHFTTEQVNDALEQLGSEVARQQDELHDKVHALSEAKQFNEMLLENSPMVVVTHDSKGTIHNLNAFGRSLSGLESKLPLGANINQWVRDPENNITLSDSLRSMSSRAKIKLQNELPFVSHDGQTYDFLWTHSSLVIKNEKLFLSLGIDITEIRRAEESLRWLGEHDRVTGLLNRSTFIEEADRQVHAEGDQYFIDLIMVDIDNLSEFNDRFGFDCGDDLLRRYANHISVNVENFCHLARTGSGEYCLLIISDAELSAERNKLDQLSHFEITIGGHSETVTATVIVSRYDHDNGSVDELMSNATSLMQRMKNKAKGHVYYANTEDSKENRQEKYQLKEQLIQSLNNNRLVLFYQPIIDLKSQRISHCESLVRMLDDDGNFIPPGKFLGIATESGLMPQIDYLVIEKALRQLAAWQQADVKIQLSINITAPTLEQPDFSKRLAAIIENTGVSADAVIFELVETDALDSIDNARTLLEQIKSSGAQIALDDFGVGFTSFEYVRELPVDYIKIDQAFIRFIHERENDQALVRSIIEMSHSLGKKVIAEGVEGKPAMDLLADMQVDYIQGYYISRPVPINALDLSIRI